MMATYATLSYKWLMVTTFFVFSSTLFLIDTYFSLNLEKLQSHAILYVCLLSHFNHIRLSATLGLQPTRLLCPWDFSGKNTGVGRHTLLQGIFPTQELKLGLFCLLHWQMSSLHQCHLGSPLLDYHQKNIYEKQNILVFFFLHVRTPFIVQD